MSNTFRYIKTKTDGDVMIAMLNRADKRNALSECFIEEIEQFFTQSSKSGVKAMVLCADGKDFCAGLDLVEHYNENRSAEEFMFVCRKWHKAFEAIQYAGFPVITALKGAVVGGGLELASASHIRVADRSTYFALPEGQRGIFTGGGATVRVAELIGQSRMIDMMLTGRIYTGEEAVNVGLCQYLENNDHSLTKAIEIAKIAAQNPPLSNFAITSAISHIGNMPSSDAFFSEAFIAGITNTQAAAQERLAAFANKSAPKTKMD